MHTAANQFNFDRFNEKKSCIGADLNKDKNSRSDTIEAKRWTEINNLWKKDWKSRRGKTRKWNVIGWRILA